MLPPAALLVDDSDAIVATYALILRDLAIPLPVTSAKDALSIFNELQARIGVVVTDGNMVPGQDGIWLAKKLRALSPDLPIVLVTEDREFGVQARETGLFVSIFAKPCPSQLLRHEVQRQILLSDPKSLEK
jgi:CheY-like chemotaxis protein